MDKEAWHAVIHGVAKSWTRLSDWTELNWTLIHALKESCRRGEVAPGDLLASSKPEDTTHFGTQMVSLDWCVPRAAWNISLTGESGI